MKRASWAGAGLVTAAVLVVAGAGAAAADDVLLPHPGPDGLVWVPERTGDGGFVSGGADARKPTTVTVACEGGGGVFVTVESQGVPVAGFPVECPAGTPGSGARVIDAGLVAGSFAVAVDASTDTLRWAATVTQPD
ncbi:hypothetical protein [Streptomyces sp. URMC 129]|uniref:hypothetical protein n=1 Tax=Streptomyces sp. URMC 129 TaxID=3423407 RepID=UPI003F1DDC24